MLHVRGLGRAYDGPDGSVPVLAGVDLDVAAGERVTIAGPSGTGKTTLLSVLGLLDDGFSGTYHLMGDDVAGAGDTRLATWRLRRVGYVFQDARLVPTLTAEENVRLPAQAARTPDARQRAATLLAAAGLGHRTRHLPAALSTGERRRVAVARALVNRPPVLLLDEPLAGLDEASAAGVEALVAGAWQEGAAVVTTGHGAGPGRTVRLERGRLVHGTAAV